MTAKYIIRVNGIDFDNDFIEFRRLDNEYAERDLGGLINVPTSLCFVYVWQKSNNFEEFQDNMKSLYDAYVTQHPEITASLYSVRSRWNNYYKSRSYAYRRKGVKLKRFPKKNTSSHKDWESLAKFAENIH